MVCSIAGLVVVLALAAAPAPALAGQSAAPAAKGEAKASKAPARAETVVNLNTATQADLESLPGIGKSTAQRILDYRQKSGGFKKVEDLLEILESVRFSGGNWPNDLFGPSSGRLRTALKTSGNLTASQRWWAQWWAQIGLLGRRASRGAGESPLWRQGNRSFARCPSEAQRASCRPCLVSPAQSFPVRSGLVERPSVLRSERRSCGCWIASR